MVFLNEIELYCQSGQCSADPFYIGGESFLYQDVEKHIVERHFDISVECVHGCGLIIKSRFEAEQHYKHCDEVVLTCRYCKRTTEFDFGAMEDSSRSGSDNERTLDMRNNFLGHDCRKQLAAKITQEQKNHNSLKRTFDEYKKACHYPHKLSVLIQS